MVAGVGGLRDVVAGVFGLIDNGRWESFMSVPSV
jgi:hypothetical protein